MKILLTIAARGGSKGVKNKNIRPLCNKPLISYTIEQALQWGKAKNVVVTTDSAEIAEISKRFGAEVPFLRPAEMAQDTSSKLPALRHAALEMEKLHNTQYEVIVDLDPTAPVRKISDIDSAMALFLDRRPKSLFSAVASNKSPYFNMVEIDSQGWAQLSKKTDNTIFRRQDSPKVYALNASIYIYSREYLIDPKTIGAISDHSVVYEMDSMSAVDIDREIDFLFVENLVSKGLISI